MVVKLLNGVHKRESFSEVFLSDSSECNLFWGENKGVGWLDEDLAFVNDYVSSHVEGAPSDFDDSGVILAISFDSKG